MSKRWEQDQKVLLDAIPRYRAEIRNLEAAEARKITRRLARELYGQTSELQARNKDENAVYERLPYLENLLAGALRKEDYAQKDGHLYGTLPREDGSRAFNPCNSRHSYNGAVR
ncbi:hypothetical protein [Paenibacillus mucilaginosus]|uniref:Uncharacterized protein n=1 Tax=Paenibacillus mucilaginosus (strain KNP414) TaxID=1036673 RepID=F8F9H3_PAEMK|nr:hypothetical protein [Paenibacillus mucilaginosus]AEI43662.1 hypothetical protein KNP414_05138 [Paenibacillus mucilaginosus KNP414]MCG7216903.1 hypothetical protein [Paenibacillus mucilaginosus]WDM25190.1 hypothetical protein KCX80_22285 [Paenibacillus mucilaginosus]